MTDLIVQATITPLAGQGTTSFNGNTIITTNLTPTGLQFHHVQGLWIPSLMDVPDIARRLGGAGTIAQSTGTGGREIAATLQACFSAKQPALTFIASCEALSNAICSIVDGWGRTIPRVRITKPAAEPKAYRGCTVNGQPVIVQVQCQFTFERLTDT